MKTFAAIDLGSYEIAMKIFEISKDKGMKQIDHLRHRVELGTDTYQNGKISNERVGELCKVLCEFAQVMKSYKVDNYKAYGTSAIRETENTSIIIEQIKLRTGIAVEVLSNSEQRFMHYKAVASKGVMFDELMKESCAIVDIGGGSIQISLFDKASLVTTQNLRLGILRVKDMLASLQARTTNYEELLGELIDNQLEPFRNLYLSGKCIDNIIVVDDYVWRVMKRLNNNKDIISKAEFLDFVNKYRNSSSEQIAASLGMTEESASLFPQSAILLKKIFAMMGAKRLWAPGVSLSDGIAYEYAERMQLIRNNHDFDEDILGCAYEMCRRYNGNIKRNALVEKVALAIYDGTRKLHGMGKRERLLLRIASILGDCGKFVSLEASAECGYDIIMATEMIGLSHAEREIIANIVRFNKTTFQYYKQVSSNTRLDLDSYIKVAKLTAIFRVADGICRSYRTKLNDVKINLRGDEMIVTIDSDEDFTLEKGFFGRKSDFFEEVFSMKTIIRNKKTLKSM